MPVASLADIDAFLASPSKADHQICIIASGYTPIVLTGSRLSMMRSAYANCTVALCAGLRHASIDALTAYVQSSTLLPYVATSTRDIKHDRCVAQVSRTVADLRACGVVSGTVRYRSMTPITNRNVINTGTSTSWRTGDEQYEQSLYSH
eukprot:scaffold323245_cov48-Prasinocladus_malaysianus.AAC.2